jgi:TonB family protein
MVGFSFCSRRFSLHFKLTHGVVSRRLSIRWQIIRVPSMPKVFGILVTSTRGSPPWALDIIAAVAPAYPFRERNLRHEGMAIVRLTLNIKTGRVVKATLLKSSGYRTLDDCAIAAFSRWVWRAGRWKEIDEGVMFRLSRNPYAPPPRGSFRLPHL